MSARNQSPRVSGDQRKKVGEDDSEEKFSKNGRLPESFADQSTEIDTEYEDREPNRSEEDSQAAADSLLIPAATNAINPAQATPCGIYDPLLWLISRILAVQMSDATGSDTVEIRMRDKHHRSAPYNASVRKPSFRIQDKLTES